MKKSKLYIVIPCYNEEEVLIETSKRIKEKMETLILTKKISENSKVVFVNDGSKDQTWNMIQKFHKEDPVIMGINLSRNRGHQNALLAGLLSIKDDCDMAISMDADLQDDIDAIDRFVEQYQKGFDIVYGVRSSRQQDTFFKRNTALLFYRFMQAMGVEIVYNHADYRLMSKRVIQELEHFKEVNLFLRGIIPLIGFSSTTVTYVRNERFAGVSKYPLKKMLSFAVDGITSFSVKPIRVIFSLGLTICCISIIAVLILLIRLCFSANIHMLEIILLSLWLVAGLILTAIGVIGEYIGKIYMETKERPRYIIDEILK